MAGLLHAGEPAWEQLAEKRKKLINQYCWDEKAGLYYDYNFKTTKKSRVAAVTAFQPLWAGMASGRQAGKLKKNLCLFETPWGLATTTPSGDGKAYQWGETAVWAPMQLLAADGLLRYGYKKAARRIAESYMQLVGRNYYFPVSSAPAAPVARTAGMIYEKYTATGAINDNEYPASVMMGWTAAVYNCVYFYFLQPPF